MTKTSKYPIRECFAGTTFIASTRTSRRAEDHRLSYFDVPAEAYAQGWLTGMKAAAEFMSMFAADGTEDDAFRVLCEAAEAVNERGQDPSRRGAGIAFLREMAVMLHSASKHLDHKTYFAASIDRYVRQRREGEARLAAEKLATLANARARRAAAKAAREAAGVATQTHEHQVAQRELAAA